MDRPQDGRMERVSLITLLQEDKKTKKDKEIETENHDHHSEE